MSLQQDPRTGLDWIDIPPEFQPVFYQLGRDPIMYWMGHAKLYYRGWSPRDAVVIVSDNGVYNMKPEGELLNFLRISEIDQLIVDESRPTWVVLKVREGVRNSDMLFDVLRGDARDNILLMLQAVASQLGDGRDIPVMRVKEGAALKDALRLDLPEGFKPDVEKFESRRAVARQFGYDEVGQEMSHRDQQIVYQEFEKVKDELRNDLASYGAEEFEEISRSVDMYIEMLEDRDREIDRLRHLRDTIYDNPQVWDSCPNCRTRSSTTTSRTTTKTISSLERRIADAEHLLDHLQHARQVTTNGKRATQYSESTQLIQLKQQKHAVNEKIKELRHIIIESPGVYPSTEARKGALSRVGPVPRDATERETQLARHAHDLDRTLAEKDKELRMTKSVMRESFQRQVEELERLKGSFGAYDQEIVAYLERVFNGTTYPPGATDRQTPRELAELTASAARANATPVTIPETPATSLIGDGHTLPGPASPYPQEDLTSRSPRRAWLGANLQPLSERPSQASRDSVL